MCATPTPASSKVRRKRSSLSRRLLVAFGLSGRVLRVATGPPCCLPLARIYWTLIPSSSKSDQVRDGVGVIAQQRQLLGARREQACALLHQVPQAQHAQPDAQGIVEVAARHVDMRAGRLQAL